MPNIQYVYSHLQKTDSIQGFAQERIESVLEKFRAYKIFSSRVRMEMKNSPEHAGKDEYSCEVFVKVQRFPTVVIKKTSANLYEAISLVSDRLLNLLSRIHEKRCSLRRRALPA